MSNLYNLNVGDSAYINFSPDDSFTCLNELGLINGTKVECVIKAPFGETKAYLIRGAVIALHRSDAEKIFISEENLWG